MKISSLETSRLLLVPSSMKYFEERSRIASDIENTRFMMFLPKPKEETFDYIKICETQWESENQTLLPGAVYMISRSFDMSNPLLFDGLKESNQGFPYLTTNQDDRMRSSSS